MDLALVDCNCFDRINEVKYDNQNKEDYEFIEIVVIPENQFCTIDSSLRVLIIQGVGKEWDAEVIFYAMLDLKKF